MKTQFPYPTPSPMKIVTSSARLVNTSSPLKISVPFNKKMEMSNNGATGKFLTCNWLGLLGVLILRSPSIPNYLGPSIICLNLAIPPVPYCRRPLDSVIS